MIVFFQMIISVICIFCLGYYLIVLIKDGEFISFPSMIIALAILDFYIPAFVGALTGGYKNSTHYPIRDNTTYFYATILYSIFLLLFFFGYSLNIRFRYRTTRISDKSLYDRKWVIKEGLLSFFFITMFSLIVLNLFLEYKALGNWEAFYKYKITREYLGAIEFNSPLSRIVQLSSGFNQTILFITCAIGFLNYKSLKRKFFWHFLAPFFTFLLILTTLYRGTILNFVCMIVVCIQLSNGTKSIYLSKKAQNSIKRLVFAGAIVFLAYGTVRTSLNNSRWDIVQTNKDSFFEMISNTFGTTLVAFSRCIQYVSEGGKLLYGSTIYEMFLAFIPRSIMPSKPVQYGIISIDLAMGMPSTSMSAVSAPGELIANFGIFGLLFVPIIGIAFKQLSYMRDSNRYCYFYAAIVSSLVTTTLWMGFTGFFSTLKYSFLYIFVLCLVVKKRRSKES